LLPGRANIPIMCFGGYILAKAFRDHYDFPKTVRK